MSANAKGEPAQTTTEWAQSNIAGSFGNADEVAQRIRLAAERCHLIGGASVAPLVEGHEIVLSVVPINRRNCYPSNTSAKRAAKGQAPDPEDAEPPVWGLGKADLMALAAAAGIEWTSCNRLDDGSSAHFAHYEVEGRYRQIDGSWRTVGPDQRDIDLRDGSPQVANLTQNQLTQMRETLIRSCITKARLRAIRGTLGVAHGMVDEDIERPFVFARMVFTGRSNDPSIRRLFAEVIAHQQLAATHALYGRALPQLSAMPAPPALAAAPAPVQGEFVDAEFPSNPDEPAPPTKAAPPPPAPSPAPQQPAQSGAGGAEPPRGGWAIPGGHAKGTLLPNAADKDLAYWGKRIAKELDGGDVPGKHEARNRGLLEAIREEQVRRESPGTNDPPAGHDPETGEVSEERY
jgi:hypothetical protein